MLNREWLAAFLPIGGLVKDGTWKPLGAGALISSPPVLWFVTAAHVVSKHAGERLVVLVSKRGGGVLPRGSVAAPPERGDLLASR